MLGLELNVGHINACFIETTYIKIVLLAITYIYLSWNFDYWRKRKIFGPKPLPFFGNYPKSAVLLQNVMYEQQELYEKYKEKHRFIGIFERRTPKLLILDSKLVSDIYVKYFKHFQINDSSNSFDKHLDPIFTRNLFASQHDDWRNTRTELSPAFTQSKLRQIFSMIWSSGQKMIGHIDMQIGNGRQRTIDTKDLTSRFTSDTVMNCIYGLEANDSVHRSLVEWFSPSLTTNIVNVLLSTFPILTCVYKPSFFPTQLTQWFYDVMCDATKYRHQNQSNRNDFLNFLLERKHVKNYSNEDIAEFAAIFLFDGFETSSMILAQALYHIAKNEECQMRLRAEIFNHFPNDERPTADAINEMQYLDNIVNETIRIGPSAFLLAKCCTEPIELHDYDGTKLLVEAGTSIQLPVFALHHDERFYEKPNSFQPERFELQSPNELKRRGQFLAFGDGQRICIGQKFAGFQIKLALVEIVRRYSITVNSKTTEPIIASPLDSLLTPISEIYLDFESIDEKND
ncbi:probable cytochrome P450 28a5 isoform X2 [Sitodiplosis mosellana]|uniref:probable cytochrome P450 28a5 isoform X2 n=1 Tax=Sitodiplosis mosellana TaxID=263140 RepID=UPI002445163F|nr:probable cytochrome P450 28a5 isoform X2 [Sitodiplosis mosellana]